MGKKKKSYKKEKDRTVKAGNEPFAKQGKIRPSGSLLDKLEESVFDLDYSNVLVSAMGHWFSIEALSIIEDIFEGGIIGPSKISDDVGDAIDFIFTSSQYPKKEYEVSQAKEEKEELSSQDILPIVEDLHKKGCRFFENLVFSIFETPIELTAIEVASKLSQGEKENLDIVTQDGHGHSVFDVKDLEYIGKYGLSKTEKEFLEDKVLSKLKEDEIVVEDKKVVETMPPPQEKSMGDYLDSGGMLFVRRPQGGIERLRTREQLWEIEPALMDRNKKEFLGLPDYIDLIKKSD